MRVRDSGGVWIIWKERDGRMKEKMREEKRKRGETNESGVIMKKREGEWELLERRDIGKEGERKS